MSANSTRTASPNSLACVELHRPVSRFLTGLLHVMKDNRGVADISIRRTVHVSFVVNLLAIDVRIGIYFPIRPCASLFRA